MQGLPAHGERRNPSGGGDHDGLLRLVDKALEQGGFACPRRTRHKDVVKALVYQRENLVRLDRFPPSPGPKC